MQETYDINGDLGKLPADLLRNYRERLENELGFVCKSRQMKQVKAEMGDYLTSDKAITIFGPSGVGRRTLAKAMHLSSSNWWRPFFETDFTGVDEENSLKSLFGHKAGHFFSPSELKPGFMSLAAKSTLCLKNFDRYSKSVQKEIYNSYVNRKFKLVSDDELRPLECRLIFTIQNKPVELKRTGRLDEDVCNMLSDAAIGMPPLGNRKDDIIPLAEKFIHDCCHQFGIPVKKLSKEAEKWLKRAPWNEHVNQLKKSVYYACFNTVDGLLHPNHFALAHDGNIEDYQNKQLEELSIQSLIEMKLGSFLGRLGQFEASDVYEAIMSRVEEPLLRLVLDYSKGNQIKASRMLGINRNTLRTKVNKYNIKISREGKIV